jgi:hypothetical protein
MTRVAAFSPLLFWPGIVGEFMKYMPITLIVTLSASMVYALIFVPTLGAIIAKPFKHPPRHKDGAYMWVVGKAVRHPVIVLLLAAIGFVAVPYTYGKIGKGVNSSRMSNPIRPSLRQGARQPLDPGKGRPGPSGRKAHPRLAGDRERSIPAPAVRQAGNEVPPPM